MPEQETNMHLCFESWKEGILERAVIINNLTETNIKGINRPNN
jgi:hypothetical protein